MNRSRIVIRNLDAPRGVKRTRIEGLCAKVSAQLRREGAPAKDEQAKRDINAQRASGSSRAGQ